MSGLVDNRRHLSYQVDLPETEVEIHDNGMPYICSKSMSRSRNCDFYKDVLPRGEKLAGCTITFAPQKKQILKRPSESTRILGL
jgi:hypothetical protein